MSTNPFSDPYRSPQFAPPPPLPHGQRPAVMTWYMVYCVAMALLYFLCVVFGALMLTAPGELADGEETPDVIFMQGMILTVLGAALLFLYGAAPFLPRSKFAWIYGFVTIGIGFTSCCTLPFSIALLVFWLGAD